jgi:addiction module RelE/StbE family toxin
MTIRFNKAFKKNFKKLTQSQKRQFYIRLQIFKNDKSNFLLKNHGLNHPYEGCRSINITGDIRAIYTEVKDIYWFIDIGSHSDLYN